LSRDAWKRARPVLKGPGRGNAPRLPDREVVEAWLKIDPGAAFSSRANRAVLGRAVRYLAGDAGVRQFLDIGTGIPTAGNTHQIAQAIVPESRVVYVDYDHCKPGCAHALSRSSRLNRVL